MLRNGWPPITDEEAESGWKDRKNQKVCMSHQGHGMNSLRPPWEKQGLKVLEEVQSQWSFMVIGLYTGPREWLARPYLPKELGLAHSGVTVWLYI